MKPRIPRQSEMKQLREKLRKYGDDLPEADIRKATTPKARKQWLVIVKNGEILAAGRTYKKDWYEWVVKNAFVIPKARNQGLASVLYAELTDKAEREGAYIAEADITSDNIPSKIAAVRAGMRPVNNFRYSRNKKDKPADIYQEVFIPPSQREINTINNYILKSMKSRNKTLTPYVLSPKPFPKLKK